MTAPAISLLDSLAESFRASAAGSGSATRDFLIDYEKLLKLSRADDGDAREVAEAFLRECEVESKGILQVERDRVTRRGLRVRLRKDGGEEWLFARLDRTSPSALRASTARFFEEAAHREVPADWQSSWESWFHFLAGQALSGASVAPFRHEDPAGNALLLKALDGVLRWNTPTTIRYASSALLGDSKLLQSLEAPLATALEAITGDASLEARKILPKPRQVAVHGPLVLSFPGRTVNLKGLPAPVWLSDVNITMASALNTEARFCLTVENEDVFFELAKSCPEVLLVQTSYPGAGTRRLLRALPSDLPFFHFGDTDPAGFDILRDLREKTGRSITPLLMDFRPAEGAPVLTLDEIALCQRLLENPLLRDVVSPLQAMLHAGTKGDFEQESIPLPTVLASLA
jgi:hypothetical protein